MGEDSLFGAGHHSRRRASPFAKYSYGVPAHLGKTHRLGGRRRSSAWNLAIGQGGESISNRGLANEVSGLSFSVRGWKSLKQKMKMSPHT
jgi:hypothetical protein